jgi:hypothetical protein
MGQADYFIAGQGNQPEARSLQSTYDLVDA